MKKSNSPDLEGMARQYLRVPATPDVQSLAVLLRDVYELGLQHGSENPEPDDATRQSGTEKDGGNG